MKQPNLRNYTTQIPEDISKNVIEANKSLAISMDNGMNVFIYGLIGISIFIILYSIYHIIKLRRLSINSD